MLFTIVLLMVAGMFMLQKSRKMAARAEAEPDDEIKKLLLKSAKNGKYMSLVMLLSPIWMIAVVLVFLGFNS